MSAPSLPLPVKDARWPGQELNAGMVNISS